MHAAPPALGVQSPPPALARALAAQIIIVSEAAVLLLIGIFYAGAGSGPVLLIVSFIGAPLLLWGGLRIGRDQPTGRGRVQPDGLVPWDWSDFLMFWPGAFAAYTILVSLTVPATDLFITGTDQTVRTAVESAVGQASMYAGGLFNIFVLVGLRRRASLADLGWRRFSWWWIPLAVALSYATLYIADILQALSQRLFPSALNSQCVAVQHEYGHFVALAILVVCIVTPIAEETIFRGFTYGWLRRWLPVGLAVPASGALFAALHGVLLLFIPLFFVGCLLAAVFQVSRSLWPGAVVHALFNLPGIIAILSAPSC